MGNVNKAFNRLVASFLIALLALLPAFAQSSATDADINARIREEGLNNSQIMRTVHWLADIYGPRLTGSPNHQQAAEWAINQMQAWGLENAHLEAWDFGHPGWLNERLTAHIISPVKDSLVCEVLAWTPSTKGVVRAKAYQPVLPERPSQDDLNAFFEKEKANVSGKLILVGKPRRVQVNFDLQTKRLSDEQLRARFNPTPPPTPTATPTPVPPPAPDRKILITPLNEQLDNFLLKNGALMRINDAGEEHGQIRAFNNRTFDVSKTVPTVVMRNEDYGRISRILADSKDVVLEFDIVNLTYPEGKTSFNAIAEIPGTD
jgi:carboxypeptidase Q